jgi:hypothetical protein
MSNILSLARAASAHELQQQQRKRNVICACLTFPLSSLPFVSTLSKPLLDVKSCDANDLNSWSLETFFDRVVGFVWALVVVLTWLPWYLGFLSLVRHWGQHPFNPNFSF